MKVLITGGYGYLGQIIANKLYDQGYSIRLFGPRIKNITEADSKKYELQVGDIRSNSDLEKACFEVDTIVHLAALNQEGCEKEPLLALEINGLGVRNILDVGEKLNVKKCLYVSSVQVFGNKTEAINDKTYPLPSNNYGISKFIGELYCKNHKGKMICTVARLSNGYGLSNNESGLNLVVNNFCKQAYESKKINLKTSGTQKRNFISTKDIANSLYKIISSSSEDISGRVFNIYGLETKSIYDVAILVSKVYKKLYGRSIKISFEKDLKKELNKNLNFKLGKVSNLGYFPKHNLKDEIEEIFRILERKK